MPQWPRTRSACKVRESYSFAPVAKAVGVSERSLVLRRFYGRFFLTIGTERRQSPVLGDHVFVGAGAKIIGAISIGSGSRIGANAVVLHDIPAGVTAVGIPAKVVQRPRLQHPDSGVSPQANIQSELQRLSSRSA
jgi:hypothetical protein